MEDDEHRPTEAMAVPPSHDDPFAVDSYALAHGTNVGGYVIDGELGRGGMGVVYSAKHPIIGKRVAIKVLKPSLSNNPATVERFIQEARSVNAIGHPNIVDIFDFDTLPDGRRFLVMDLLEGESLRKRVKRGPLHVSEAAMVIDEVASALDAAHQKGFIHRDLKPDNVFLVANPGRTDVKLLDFGLAKLMPSSTLENNRAYRTATGAQLGTPDYMSPEQIRGDKDIDHRTDIYALGVVAFEIITGKRPRKFSDGTFDINGKPAEVVGAVPLVPAQLAELVESMLANAAEHRPSLVAVRAVIKRMRPSLPSMSVAGMEVSLPPVNDHISMSPSKVGAKPVLPTPPTGSSVIGPPVPATAAQIAQQAALRSTRPGTTPPIMRSPSPALRPPTEPPFAAGSQMPLAAASQPPFMDGRRPSTPPQITPAPDPRISNAGLRQAGAPAPATRVGVPPPPMKVTRPHPVEAARTRSSRLWLVVGIVLALAAGVALALVIAT